MGVKYERRAVEKEGECEDRGKNTLFAILFHERSGSSAYGAFWQL